MNSFIFENYTKIVFGKDSVEKLKGLIPKEDKNILLHYGQGSIKKNGLYDKVVKILEEEGRNIIELAGVEPNPKLSLVREGIKLSKENNIDFILAVGGGSVIDSAKAIAVGNKYNGDLWDLFIKDIEIEEATHTGAILTIPATGSETSTGTVITNEETVEKLSIGSDILRPQFAILNPELTMTLPSEQTFAGIMDIISHVIERYITQTDGVDFTSRLCEGTIRSVMDHSYTLLAQPNNYNARANIMLAGTIAHSNVLGLGREEDWASHDIGHELSAIYEMTHGVSLAIIMPHWMEYVYRENIDVFDRFARHIFHIHGDSKEENAVKGIQAFKDYIKDIGLPNKLSELDIDNSRFKEMAKKAISNGNIGSFMELDKEDVYNIYKLAE